jgi:hypothetical protein
MVQSYLLNSPPAIIVAPLDEDDTTDFVEWGYVERGTSQAAMRNELFVDSELTSALISVYDPTVCMKYLYLYDMLTLVFTVTLARGHVYTLEPVALPLGRYSLAWAATLFNETFLLGKLHHPSLRHSWER